MGIPVLWDSPWFSAGLHSWSAHNLQRKVHALTLPTFKESIMLNVYLQNVLNLEDLSHPRWTHILVLHLLFIGAFISFVQLRRRSFISVHDCPASAVHHICRLITAVFLHARNLELKVFGLFGFGGTPRFFLSFQTCDEGVIVTCSCLSATKLSVKLKFVAFDVFVTLAVIAIEPYVDHLPWVKHVLHQFYFTNAFSRAEDFQANR